MTHPREEEFQGRRNWGVWKYLILQAGGFKKHLLRLAGVAVVLAGVDTMFPLMIKYIVDDITTGGGRWWIYCLAYFGLVLMFTGCVASFIYLAGKITTGFSHDLRKAAFARLQELSFSYYDHRPVGWLVARLTTDVDRLSRILAWGLLDSVWGSFFLLFLTGMMLVVNWKLALVVLTVVPVLAVLTMVFQRKLLRTSRERRRLNSQITASFSESINGVRTTKTLVREKDHLGEFDDLTGRMYEVSVLNAILSSIYFPVVLTLASAGAALALWYGGQSVLAGAIQLGTLTLFIVAARQFFQPIQDLARLVTHIQAAHAAVERVVGILQTEPEIQDSPEVRRRIDRWREEAKRFPNMAKDGYDAGIETVEFHHVDFAYDENQMVLEDFNLTVRRGETIALVGPTGGGKSTIVSLLCRFYEPTGGEILINGVEYRQRSLDWLQSNLGIVLQSPQLFSGSIMENIRYGRLEASDEEVIEAARLTGVDEFAQELPEGYRTDVGESGGAVSTGQKQLISFARAVLADPQIFVMDEATSSVDTEAEQAIQRSMKAMLHGRISFVIAHRLSTIRSADRILVIEDGRIIESGSHRELIHRRGHYYRLYTNQFTEEHTAAVLQGGGEDN